MVKTKAKLTHVIKRNFPFDSHHIPPSRRRTLAKLRRSGRLALQQPSASNLEIASIKSKYIQPAMKLKCHVEILSPLDVAKEVKLSYKKLPSCTEFRVPEFILSCSITAQGSKKSKILTDIIYKSPLS